MNWILMLFLIGFLCWISATDIRRQIIPDKVLGIAVLFRLGFFLCIEGLEWQGIAVLFLNGFAISVPLLILILVMEKIKKMEVMGGGDIKLLFVIGMYIGWEKSLVAFLVACMIGIVVGMIQMRKDNTYFPFGPSIALGTLITILIS